MSRLKSLLLAASLAVIPLPLLAATPGAVQAEQSPTMPAPDGNFSGRHGGGKLAGMLTPEQRAAFMLGAREQTRDMTSDQRRAWRKDQMQKLGSMSQAERQKLTVDLQARWDALPADQKARLQQRMAERGGPPPAR
jgi:outer membrane receptor for ferrienterochelin and colicin